MRRGVGTGWIFCCVVAAVRLGVQGFAPSGRWSERGLSLRLPTQLAASPRELDRAFEEAGEGEWRGVAGAQSLEDLVDYIAWLREDRVSLRQNLEVAKERLSGGKEAFFDFGTAAKLAGYAFETYNEPEGARWEEGTDKVRVAFKSDDFVRSVYSGRLTLRLLEADDLPKGDLAESLVSGSGFKPFCMFAITEGDEAQDKVPVDGVRGLKRATDVAQSTMVPGKDNGKGKSKAKWENQEFFLYVKDPTDARLVITVMDQAVLKASQVIGATSAPLQEVLDLTKKDTAQWNGWLPLTIQPPKPQTGSMAAAAIAGATLAGPAGAVAGAAGAYFLKNQNVEGKLKLDLEYTSLDAQPLAATDPDARLPPKGGTEGLDWGELAELVGVDELTKDLEFCAFVSAEETDTQVALWRDESRKRLVVAFRGTSAPGDLVTDVKLVQTPWKAPLDSKQPAAKSDGSTPMVHAGFREALDSVQRRLKELIVAACRAEVADWTIYVTGHSLGGALATLCALDLAEGGVNAGRALPTEQPEQPWWGRLFDPSSSAFGAFGKRSPPRPKRLLCYTFGAPRVGNTALADVFNAQAIEAYRVVNGADVVARLPRHKNAAGGLLDYEHCGRTVLVGTPVGGAAGTQALKGLAEGQGYPIWVEGETDVQACPLRDGTPISDPLADGSVLFEALREGVQQKSAKATLDKLKRLSPSQVASLVGLDARFIEAELQMLSAIGNGNAIMHHLEPSYFQSMMGAEPARAAEQLQGPVRSAGADPGRLSLPLSGSTSPLPLSNGQGDKEAEDQAQIRGNGIGEEADVGGESSQPADRPTIESLLAKAGIMMK